MGLKLKLLPDLMPSLSLVDISLHTCYLHLLYLPYFIHMIVLIFCWFLTFSFSCFISLKDTFIQKTKKLYQDTHTQRNIAKLNDELYEVHQIMTRNVQEVLGVGEQLDRKLFYLLYEQYWF